MKDGSGIEKYEYYVKKSNDESAEYTKYESSTITNLDESTDYIVYVVVYDNAGNYVSTESDPKICTTNGNILKYPILTKDGVMNYKDDDGNYYFYETVNSTATNAIGKLAYDDNTKTYESAFSISRYMKIDRSAVDKNLNIYWADLSSYIEITMEILNKDLSQVIYTEKQTNNTTSTSTIKITEDMYWLRFISTGGSDWTNTHGRVYEIGIE